MKFTALLVDDLESWNTQWKDYEGSLWRDVNIGDGLVYDDGALFIVEADEINDGRYCTFMLRCVVPPTVGDYVYGDVCMMSRPLHGPIPPGSSIVRPTR